MAQQLGAHHPKAQLTSPENPPELSEFQQVKLSASFSLHQFSSAQKCTPQVLKSQV